MVVVLDVVVVEVGAGMVDVVAVAAAGDDGTVPESTSDERGEQAASTSPSPTSSRFTNVMVPISRVSTL